MRRRGLGARADDGRAGEGAADGGTGAARKTASSAGSRAAIVASIRDGTRLRGDVELIARGQLPNDGKVIEDARKHD